MPESLFFQFFEKDSSTYTYLIADSGEAAIIDPVLTTAERDHQWIKDLGLNLKYIIDTHVHADHITGAAQLRKWTGATTAISRAANVSCSDLSLDDGQELSLGRKKILCLATPGHTDSCMCFYFDGKLFSGDTLLIRGSGRTDFQQGSPEKLYSSIQQKLFTLPDSTPIYPGHDYQGQTSTTIGLEKKWNPRIGDGKSLTEFVKIMSELKLSEPKHIHTALPANMACGQTQEVK